MTPQEKAKDLVDNFYQTTPNEAWFNPPIGSLSMEYRAWKQAKECALIAVDKILDKDGYNNDYWKEVKKEIEKI